MTDVRNPDAASQPGLANLLRAHAGPCALIIGVGLLLFGRVLFFDFVHYDDWEFLAQHADSVADPYYIISSFWRDAFSVLGPEARGVFYRPLLLLTYGVEAQILGANPLIYHATNLFLHLLVCCLVYFLLLAYGVARQLSVALTLVFLCHPCSAVVAAWIPGRNDVMLAIWFVVGTLCMLGFMRQGRNALLAGAVACYAGAIFSKESGGVLLGVLGAVALLELRGRPERLRPLLVASAAAGATTLLWAALRAYTLGGSPIGAARISENLTSLIVFLGKTLIPVNLSVAPYPADTSLVPGLVALGIVVGAAALSWRRLWGPAGLGLLWYGGMLIPTLLVPAQTWGLEQRIYVPMIGMLLFVASIPTPGLRTLSPRIGQAFALVVAIAFGIQSARRLPEFADPISYWESAVATSPSSPVTTSRLAWRYYDTRRLDEMHSAIDRALEVNPSDSEMYLLRGIAAGNAGDLTIAERHFTRSLELDPNSPDVWENLGKLQSATGRRSESRISLKRAEALRAR